MEDEQVHLGFGTGFGGAMSLDQAARWAAEHGFSALEINVGPTYRSQGPDIVDLEQVVREGPGRVQETIDHHGVFLASLAPQLNLLAPDPALRESLISYFRLVVDACAVLGVPIAKTYAGSAFGMYYLGLPSVGPTHPSNKLSENVALFQQVFTPLARYAEDKGVKIAFETAPRGGGHGNLAFSPYLWDIIFDAVPSPALGLAFDPSHLIWLFSCSPEEAVRRYGQRIHYVDGKDTLILPERLREQGVMGTSWWRYCVPGVGEVNWTRLIAALRSVGYDYVIAVENEDEVYPGLVGTEMAGRYLAPLVATVD
jgi:sugar phosphate isomerase/epimerase